MFRGTGQTKSRLEYSGRERERRPNRDLDGLDL